MHKPDMPGEAERILAAGGKLTVGKNGAARVNGLALSRAFGDFDDKNAGVIAEPDVNVYDIGPMDEVVVVGSDGVWDVLDYSEVLALLEPYWTRRDAEGGAKAIVEAARAAWAPNPSGYRDDILCVVAWLQ
jgi:Serine/threonine protein phosphatase